MSSKILKVPDNIASLVPYPPGKPIEELERELGITGSIKLASNENPLGPSKKAVEAIKDGLANLHRYPDGSNYYLKNALSGFLGVPPGNLIIGNGSNEIIELLIRTFMRPGDEAVMADPSFAVYPLAIKAAGGVSKLAPLKNFTHDLATMRGLVTTKTRIVFVANPNNPTGTIVRSKELDSFIESLPDDVVVCIDEAYCEFVSDKDYPRSIDYVRQGRNVAVMRTFSKVYGLAGLRVGYCVAPEEIIGYLDRVRQPFNVNSLAQRAALGALDDKEHLDMTIKNNSDGLKYLYAGVEGLGFEYVPTEANFFLIKVGDGKGYYESLLRKGVIVRPMASYGLGEYIRVSVGLPAENERFIKALEEVSSKTSRAGVAR